MISSASTLFLTALVLTTSVFSAPIRLPLVATSARVEFVSQLAAKAAVVDVEPLHRRIGLGIFSHRSARLTERGTLLETPEVSVARDIVEEPEVRRRYPRRVYQEYYEKREPQPEPVDVPAPVVQNREERPRVYPRRVYYEHFEKRAHSLETATKIKEPATTITKASTFHSPEDLASGNINPGGSVETKSTLTSISQTQTIPTSPGPAATASGIVSVVTGTAKSATASASCSSTAGPSVATVTGSASSATASTVTATCSATPTPSSVVTVTGFAAPIAEAVTPPAVVSGSTSSSSAPVDTGTSNPGIATGGDNT